MNLPLLQYSENQPDDKPDDDDDDDEMHGEKDDKYDKKPICSKNNASLGSSISSTTI
jgi:hypothetical protein